MIIELDTKTDSGLAAAGEAESIDSLDLSPEELENLHEIFDDVSTVVDGRQVIEPITFAQILNRENNVLGNSLLKHYNDNVDRENTNPYTAEEARYLLGFTDADGDGYVDFDEFVKALTLDTEEKSDIECAFESFDTDGDGQISLAEMVEGMKEMGATEEQLKPVFDMFDVDGNGTLSFFEFEPLAQQILGIEAPGPAI